MSSNGEEVRRAAMAELARRELAKRQAVSSERGRPGFLSEVGRGMKNSAVDLYRGATNLVNLPLDLLTSGYNAVSGRQLPTATEQQAAALSNLGMTPQYRTNFESVGGAINRGLGGAAVTMGAGGLMAGSPSAAVSGVGNQLASQPVAQLASAGAGSASGELARQRGAGQWGQLAAALAGGLAGGALAPKPPPTQADLYEQFLASQSRGAGGSANAAATATASPGVSQAGSSIQASPTITARGGGYNFGTVGDDVTGLNEPMARVANAGRSMGFRLTPGQITGSKALQQLEAKLESQPMTSGPFNQIRANNQAVLNRAVGSNIGVSSSVLDESTLSGALEKIQSSFRDVADDNIRPIDAKDYLRFVAELQDETRGLVKGVLNNDLIEDLTGHATRGGATGQQLQSLTSKLGAAANKQMTTPMGDRDLGMALYRAKDYVDDLLTQGLDETRLNNFMRARAQYRSLMLLTQRSGVVNPSSGNVRGGSLATVLQQKDKRGFLFGQNRTPMYEAARFAQAFGPIVGDSGTATRSALPSATDFLISLPVNLAARAYTSSPSVSAAANAQAMARAIGGRAPLTVGGAYPSALAAALLAQDQDRRRRKQ